MKKNITKKLSMDDSALDIENVSLVYEINK